ncbi:amidohydrolase family protein [uncultured Eudoraea sp.]|uniref:amidohydrolase family protein n=1 Tax=uncultured Eudoraea sp. TaxID=1035614 RepID=UPI0026361D1C|nr:amidohydrolase family protein [uncultured Eudoraea sp.]
MKTQIFTLLTVVLLLVSCNNQIKDKSSVIANKNSHNYKGPIIDMHIHAFTEGNPLFGMTHPPTLRGETFEGVTSAAEQKEKTLEKFRKHKIVKAMVSNGKLWFDDVPETMLIGGADKGIDALRNQHQEGKLQVIAEMAPFYAGILADDPSILPYFELAQELDIPVGFHIFPGGPNYGFHMMPEMLGGMRTYNANPAQLENVLVKYPNLRLYIMHGGWPYVEDLKALMYAHPNVYIGIAVVNWILPQEEFNAYLKSLINAGFGDRIMFGSDQMVWPQTIDIAVETVNSVNFLTPEQKEDIFYNNAAKFLGLTKDEIEKHKNQ